MSTLAYVMYRYYSSGFAVMLRTFKCVHENLLDLRNTLNVHNITQCVSRTSFSNLNDSL